MSPFYQNEDYVLAIKTNFIPLFLIKKNQDFIVEHPIYGTMIKRICKKLENKMFMLKGLNEKSISSEQMGEVTLSSLKGLVIKKISRPKKRSA